jgi:hypothetical protein
MASANLPLKTRPIEWTDSGKGPLTEPLGRDLTLDDARHLAVQAGFVYSSSDENRPLEKRANLQAMFDLFGVNSLTSFRQKFYNSPLNPNRSVSKRLESNESEKWTKIVKNSSGGANDEMYVGQIQRQRPHGQGILVSRGKYSGIEYVGTFRNGLKHGFGMITTPRGEAFYGHFKEDIMWGPGSYIYPNGAPNESGGPRVRIRFDGMMNGKPCGKGVMTWSDGTKEIGLFDGNDCHISNLSWDDCRGVLLVAEENANLAKRIAAEVLDEARKQNLWPLANT